MGGKNKVYELMIEIGQTSAPLKAKLVNGYTHKWTVFVRGANNTKIEHCIQRVVFQLHESFTNPHRDISEPPFLIKETGYAGFEIPIEIYFKNRDKPNHVVFVHDLNLRIDMPNDLIKTEKLKFINPNRDFEKCLIRSGAQLLSVTKDKKERSYSPPAKKQKSSSLIPSKDMSNKPHLPTTNKSSSSSSSSSSSAATTAINTTAKPKSSKEFIDVFGAPLVFNSSQKSSSRDFTKIESDHRDSTSVNNHHEHHTPSPLSHTSVTPTSNTTSATQQPQTQSKHKPPSSSHSTHQQLSASRADPLQVIQTKISCLSDCDRLQRIVDIIEESGEWFNITSKKFEFDLKRLDKKTLSKIERCLH